MRYIDCIRIHRIYRIFIATSERAFAYELSLFPASDFHLILKGVPAGTPGIIAMMETDTPAGPADVVPPVAKN